MKSPQRTACHCSRAQDKFSSLSSDTFSVLSPMCMPLSHEMWQHFPWMFNRERKYVGYFFSYFYMFFEERCKKKLVHHNFEWVTPRWLDICRAALAVLKANHVTTGKEVNNVRQTKEWLFLFCSRRFYAPVITLWIVAIQLILCLPTTLHWVDLWVDRRLKLSDRSSSLLYRILMVMIWLWFQIFISSFFFFHESKYYFSL